MARLLIISLLFGCCLTRANTYYVLLDGNNSNNGTATNTAWRNIWYAASHVGAGDTVNVGPGEFNEYVTNMINGSAGSQITFQGARGSNGEWLTVINPSILLTNWVAAPEVGIGVYKMTNLPFTVCEMTAGPADQRLAYVYSPDSIMTYIGNVYYNSGITNGLQMMALPADTVVQDAGSYHTPLLMWDDLGALYCSTGSVAYIRFRDGNDPNTNNVRAAGNAGITWQTIWPAVFIFNQSYVTYRNFRIHGAYCGLQIRGATAHHNVVESNYFDGGSIPLQIWIGPHDNVLRGNEIFSNYLGWTNMGAYETSVTNSLVVMRHNVYNISKYLMGQGSSTDQGLNVYNAGDNNTICYNYCHHGMGEGISVQSYMTNSTFHTVVCSNTISHHSSAGLVLGPSQMNMLVHHNVLSDNASNIRIHPMDYTGETNRLVYVYRNQSWLPTDPAALSEHIYVFWMNPTGPTCDYVNYWFYHNSFSGGSGWFTPNGYVVARGGCPGFRFLNNIVSSVQTFSAYCNGVYAGWCHAGMVGACDYNLTGSVTGHAWFGTNNIQSALPEWTNAEGMSFALSFGSKAIDAAIDLTQSFTLGGTNYSALPLGTDTKVGPAWDIGAREFRSSSIMLPPRNLHAVEPGL